jgi:hypothetical protein
MAAAAVATAQHMAGRSARPNFEVELQAIEDYRRFAAQTIQRHFRGWIVRLHRARKVSSRVQHMMACCGGSAAAPNCATFRQQKLLPRSEHKNFCCCLICTQESTRREHQQSAAAQQAEAASLYKAARMIQDSWRCYKNKRIYRFFRDLIRFK